MSTLESVDCLLSVVERIWSTHVKINFVSLLAGDGFGHHALRCIFSIRLLELGFVNSSWVTFCVQARYGCHMFGYMLCPPRHGRGLAKNVEMICSYAWATRVEIHFASSLVWEGFGKHRMRWTFCSCWSIHMFGQHFFRYILFYCWHMRGFLKTHWDAVCVHTGIGWVW